MHLSAVPVRVSVSALRSHQGCTKPPWEVSHWHYDFQNILCVWMCLYYMCAWCPQRLEEGSDPLELELQMVVRCLVAACLEP